MSRTKQAGATMSDKGKWTPEDCDCGDESRPERFFCPMHGAAPIMAEALRPFASGGEHAYWCDALLMRGPKPCNCPYPAARAALRAAGVEP